jgi:hypothetical protein
MRIKIGNRWHVVTPGTPIMVEFEGNDHKNIMNMAPGATKYAVFPERADTTEDDARAWMNDKFMWPS